jgi:hypothetical protein
MRTKTLRPLVYFLVAFTSVAGFASSDHSKADGVIDKVAHAIKHAISKMEADADAIQSYFDSYKWKGIIEDEVTFDKVTLEHFRLNGHSKAIIVNPGERIEGKVHCILDRKQCSPLHFYRVVLGIKGEGAQTTIGNEFGLTAGESKEKFTLIAPERSDLYQVRFKVVDSLFKGNALDAWKDEQGNEPDAHTTVAFIFVKPS